MAANRHVLWRLAFLFIGWLLVSAAAGMAAPARAQTLVRGSIVQDTTWTLAGSPYVVQGEVVLDAHATLVLEPGVTVKMQPAAGFSLRSGAVRALGTEDRPITITSGNAAPAPGDWGAWRFLAGTRNADTRWDHVRIEYGSGIVIEQASPRLDRVAIAHHKGPAIRADLQSSPTGEGLSAQGNTLDAIVVPAGVASGRLSWALTGIPYLVEKGLVQIGWPPFSIDPADILLPLGFSGQMSLRLGVPVPEGGRLVSLDTSSVNIFRVNREIFLPAGATEAEFTVTGSSYNTGVATLTARHPELGEAVAKVTVANLPVVSVSARERRLLAGHTHRATVYITQPAPEQGVEVEVDSTPPGLLQHPARVRVPGGDTSQEFMLQAGATAAGTRPSLSVKAAGHASVPPVTLDVTGGLYVGLDYLSSVAVVGQQEQFIVAPVLPAPPVGGIRVRLSSTNPSVMRVEPVEMQLVEGQMYQYDAPPVVVTGLSPGVASILVQGDFVETNTTREVMVKDTTALSFKPVDASGKLVVGEGVSVPGAVQLARSDRPDSLYLGSQIYVTLRCEDPEICSAASVTIDANQVAVGVEVTGRSVGTTRLIAEGRGLATATIPVEVVAPGP